MNVTVAIMAHPKRKDAAEALSLSLKSYPFIDVTVVYDQGNNEWNTGERALRRGVNRGDWHLVLQDDAILTPKFYENVVGAIHAVPEKVLISLYTGTAKPMAERVKKAVDKCYFASWVRHNMLFWGVGIAIPSDHIEPMLDFVSDREELYDTRIGYFYMANMLPVYYCMPSLVNHDDDTPSLLGHDVEVPPRVAHKLADGLIRWNDQVVNL